MIFASSKYSEEYLSHTVQKDLSGAGDEYLRVLDVGFLVSNTFICGISKGDHRMRHVSLHNITYFGQMLRLTQLYWCL
jgi:hypothetical protein